MRLIIPKNQQEGRGSMSNDFSVIDALFEMLEEQNDREEGDNGNNDDLEEGEYNAKRIYTLRRWQEASFLEHAQLILIDASYRNIHEITLQSGKAVYLVPESLYLSKAPGISIEKEENKE